MHVNKCVCKCVCVCVPAELVSIAVPGFFVPAYHTRCRRLCVCVGENSIVLHQPSYLTMISLPFISHIPCHGALSLPLPSSEPPGIPSNGEDGMEIGQPYETQAAIVYSNFNASGEA